MSRRVPTPPRIKKTDAPVIGIFHAADSGISSDEQVPATSSIARHSQYVHNSVNDADSSNMPISNSIITGLLNKVKEAETRNIGRSNTKPLVESNFYSDDEDDDRNEIQERLTSKPKAIDSKFKRLAIVPKTIFYVMFLPFVLICDIIKTSFLRLPSICQNIKTFITWIAGANLFIKFKQYQIPVLPTPTAKQLLKLGLLLLLFVVIIFIATQQWRWYSDTNTLEDLLSNAGLIPDSLLSTARSTTAGIAQYIVAIPSLFFHGMQYFFAVSSKVEPIQQPGQNTEDFQTQLERALDDLLKNEKFIIRVKEETRKIDNLRLEEMLAKIKAHEDAINGLADRYEQKTTIEQSKIKDGLNTANLEIKDKITVLSNEHLPSIANQITGIKLKIESEVDEHGKKFVTLQNGVHEIREQLKVLEQQQANNSDIADLQESNYRSKLRSLEMRLDHLVSNHAMLSKSIADCSNKENSNLGLKDDELQEKIQKIINDLLDTKRVDTEQNQNDSKKDQSEEKENTISKDQMQLEIEHVSKVWKDDVLNDIRLEIPKVIADTNVERYIKDQIEKELNIHLENQQIQNQNTEQVFKPDVAQFSEEEVSRIIKSELVTYDADKTGRFDFALESAGGTIASTRCTQTYDAATAVYSVWGIPIWWESVNGPRSILQPGSNPGQCWAVKGDGSGPDAPSISVVVRLSDHVAVQSVTLEHIPETLSPDGNIKSAPKEFSVHGLNDINDPDPIHLGNFTYVIGNRPVQTFKSAKNESKEKYFSLVELKVHSNYGNPAYTCIYRFRVHGDIDPNEKSNFR